MLFVFIGIFSYTFTPDHTPLVNRMSLAIGNKPPGFRVTMLLLRKARTPEKQSFLNRIFEGVHDRFDHIPVSRCRVAGNQVYYSEYSGQDSELLPEERISLAAAVFGSDTLNRKQEVLPDAPAFLSEHVREEKFLLGTDRYGRDLFSRLLAGSRVTLGVGLLAVFISLLTGLFFGSLAGFFKGRVDQAVLWLINVIWSIPTLLLIIAISLAFGKGFEQVFIAVGLTMWVDVARIVRSQLFAVRELEYISAGRALGFRSGRIILHHMLPNILGPVLVVGASNFSNAILLEAGLSFLGIGAQPPTPSWGAMIKENYGFIIIPGSAYLAILPGIAIMLLTFAFTFVANGLRDALDSKQVMT